MWGFGIILGVGWECVWGLVLGVDDFCGCILCLGVCIVGFGVGEGVGWELILVEFFYFGCEIFIFFGFWSDLFFNVCWIFIGGFGCGLGVILVFFIKEICNEFFCEFLCCDW